MLDNDEFAFPRPDERGSDGCGIMHGSNGMTLRDWFAGQALMGALAFPMPGPEKIPNNAARDAYAYADAMLAERAKKR